MAAKTSSQSNKEKISAGEKPMPASIGFDASPESVPALPSPSHATGSPQSAQSVQPASPASPMSPISPTKKAVRRGKEIKEPIESPKTPQKTPKASPKRVVQKKKAPLTASKGGSRVGGLFFFSKISLRQRQITKSRHSSVIDVCLYIQSDHVNIDEVLCCLGA